MKVSIERLFAALELLKFKARIAANYGDSLGIDDINDVLLVAGVGIITPDSIEKKDLEVIK